jgi:hypothetical protein
MGVVAVPAATKRRGEPVYWLGDVPGAAERRRRPHWI